ncbi:MAG: hypothetical protein ACMXYD_01030 [Candidatus Woesearchaeota archaeon]
MKSLDGATREHFLVLKSTTRVEYEPTGEVLYGCDVVAAVVRKYVRVSPDNRLSPIRTLVIDEKTSFTSGDYLSAHILAYTRSSSSGLLVSRSYESVEQAVFVRKERSD